MLLGSPGGFLMKITEEMVDYVSTLSRLKLPQEEKEKMTGQLEQIVSYMDILNTLDTADVEPLSHVFPVKNVMRQDVVVPSYPREELLKNAPGRDEEAFLVPKAVE
jgi:aspartyl-tRNA(Asn)/glutamyl-tRNA(Gln) amidotransferase subunit C